MSRLIDADALRDALQYEIDKVTPPFDDTVGAVRCGIRLARNIAEDQPTVEPTLYGYKVEHLALIARVMEKDGVTPEIAVQVFKDVQTLAMKVIDEITGAVERAFEQVTETRGGGDDKAD